VSPRPRKVSDDDVFAAAYRAMNQLGPGELTLAHVADEAGVTAGALVQRFGSKRGMLLALSAQAAASAGEFIRGLAAQHASPLAAVRAYADCMAQMAQSPAALARSLGYLQIDLADPEFRAHLAVQGKATRAGLVELITAAIAKKELRRGTDAAALARAVEVAISGSMLTWAFYQEGTAASSMRQDVDAVLQPYLAARQRVRSRAATVRRR
jgi:AcrR family transcriptional regulator